MSKKVITKKAAKLIMCSIQDWVSQQWNEITIFGILETYDFPSKCKYSGLVYRNTKSIMTDCERLCACSKRNIGSNANPLRAGKTYISSTTNAFDLEEIILYLNEQFGIEIPLIKCIIPINESILDRVKNEAEVICYLNKRNVKKCKKSC